VNDESIQRDEIVARIRARLQADGVDAYLAYTPQNNHYCSGFVSWFASEHWRFHGGNLSLIPADPSVAAGVMLPEAELSLARRTTGLDDVRGYAMWIETRGLDVITAPPAEGTAPLRRPSWWDLGEQNDIVRGLLGDRGLLEGRIGTDLAFATLSYVERLRELAPRAQWTDWTAAMFELRAIKQPFEVERLRRGAELQEMGFEAVRAGLAPGVTARELRDTYTRGVLEAASGEERYADFVDSWILASVGAETGPDGSPDARRLRRGGLATLDGGARVGGYKSDGARTFALGKPPEEARRLHDTLLTANDLACAELVPGAPAAAAFDAAERHMQANGYPQYCRGQYGHSVGLEQFPEEPPYISRDETRPIQAGMVFAVETPYYGADLGAITIEDMVLITDEGPQRMHRAPRELVIVG
jgi:Xaa-Pro dipeptidase